MNKVPNASFENASNNECVTSGLFFASPWFYPTIGSSDIFSTTCPSFGYPGYAPNNYRGFQYPRTGKNYAGSTFGGYNEEYLSVKLVDSLMPGKFYCVSFYVNFANPQKYALSSIQLCLSKDTLKNPNPICSRKFSVSVTCELKTSKVSNFAISLLIHLSS